MDPPEALPDEKQTFLKQTHPPAQFNPTVPMRKHNDWKRNWSATAVSNPMMNFQHFVADDDTDPLSDEDWEMMTDLANISHDSEPKRR